MMREFELKKCKINLMEVGGPDKEIDFDYKINFFNYKDTQIKMLECYARKR